MDDEIGIQVAPDGRRANPGTAIATWLLPFGIVLFSTWGSANIDLDVVSAALVFATIVFSALLVLPTCPLPVWYVLFFVAGVICVVLTGRLNLVGVPLFALLAFVASKVNVQRSLAVLTASLGIGFTLMVTLYRSVDLNGSKSLLMWRDSSQEFVFRDSLGFGHPNQAMVYWACFSLAAIVTVRGRYRRWAALALIVGTAAVFSATDSRGGMVAIVFLMVIALVAGSKLDAPLGPVASTFLKLGPCLAFVLSIALMFFANNTTVNRLLTGRPALNAGYFGEYDPLALFGHPELESSVFDGSFQQMLLTKGILLTVAYLAVFTWIVSSKKDPRFLDMAVLASFLMLAMVENVTFHFEYLALICLCFSRQSENIDQRAFALKSHSRADNSY